MFSKTADFHRYYPHCLKKVLFMVNHEEYFYADGWPTENERPLTFKVSTEDGLLNCVEQRFYPYVFNFQAISEIPLLPETVLTLLHIGLSKSLPLNGSEIIEMVEFLSRKAALLHAFAADDQVSTCALLSYAHKTCQSY